MVDLQTVKDALATTQGIRDLSSWMVVLVRRLKRQPKDQAPGDWTARSTAYRRFSEAVVSVFQDLHTLGIVGTPPNLRGALWSWPTAVRVNQRLPDRLAETFAARFDLVLVGDHAVMEAAATVAEGLGELGKALPSRWGGGPLPEDFECHATAVAEMLGTYLTAARADLQKAG